MDTGSATNESTILGLSLEIKEHLNKLQSILDERFVRNEATEKIVTDRPQFPNILEEVLENLKDDKAHIARITSFFSTDVLPKIN